MRHEVGVVGAVGVALALAVACGPDVGEKPEQVEHRIAPCKTWCEGLYDPQCGREDPTATDHKSEADCEEHCADPENPAYNWARNDDGTDVCKDEWMDLAACLETLSCEQASEYWNANLTNVYPCKEVSRAQALCFSQWAIPEGEG